MLPRGSGLAAMRFHLCLVETAADPRFEPAFRICLYIFKYGKLFLADKCKCPRMSALSL